MRAGSKGLEHVQGKQRRAEGGPVWWASGQWGLGELAGRPEEPFLLVLPFLAICGRGFADPILAPPLPWKIVWACYYLHEVWYLQVPGHPGGGRLLFAFQMNKVISSERQISLQATSRILAFCSYHGRGS